MFCLLLVISVILAAGVSWGTEWSRCADDLESVNRKSHEAGISAVRLRELYNGYEARRFEYEEWRSLGGDCQYLQLSVNARLLEYRDEKRRFDQTMHFINEYLLSIRETCGYEFRWQTTTPK